MEGHFAIYAIGALGILGALMRGEAMQRLCDRLEVTGHDLSKFHALDFFAREGDWQTVAYASRVESLEAWEICEEFLPGLEKNLPGATIRIVDSYTYGASCPDKFDFLVLDNPQSCFGPAFEYCEHFEALPIALRLLGKRGVLVFNINWAPFNFDADPHWQRRRSEYYGINDTSRLSVEKFLLPHYRKLFADYGYITTACFAEPRNDNYLAYGVFSLSAK